MHKELMTLVKRYMNEAGAQKKQTLESILAVPNAERQIYESIMGDAQRACLRVLADACRRQRSRDIIQPYVVRDADKLTAISDGKARKTACILIGICAPDACADTLAKALDKEDIRFVRPSIILALGNTSDPARYLKGYTVEPGEAKHVREEQDALKKALSKTHTAQKTSALKLPMWCTLTTLNIKALRAELKDKQCRFYNKSRLPRAVEVKTQDIKGLRCYSDALYYISEDGEYKAAAEKLNTFGLSGLSYRIEAGSCHPEKRRDMIRQVSDGLAAYGYTDNPSAYSFEVRLEKGAMYAVFTDTRFEYRKQSVPASINPVAAACIMRLCKPYMKENARVLDPFCGSATMLVERGLIKKTAALDGVDISSMAIKAACANRRSSGLSIALIKGDILEYGGSGYDEIVTNMPFGLRVSGHQSNIALYRSFAVKIPDLLKTGGMAFLFTQEKKLLRDVIGACSDLAIVSEETFETGGLCPTLFIVSRERGSDKHGAAFDAVYSAGDHEPDCCAVRPDVFRLCHIKSASESFGPVPVILVDHVRYRSDDHKKDV